MVTSASRVISEWIDDLPVCQAKRIGLLLCIGSAAITVAVLYRAAIFVLA